MRALAALRATHGAVFVTGNHEFYSGGAQQWLDFYSTLGITVLNTGSLYLDSLIYGYYSPVFVFGTLPLRLAICAGKGIVLALLLPTLLRVTRRALQPHTN